MNVSAHITATDPVMEWLPLTSHATMAIIHPPTTPLQKICRIEGLAACVPSCTSACSVSGCRALVRAANNANRKAPAAFDGRTIAHNRAVVRKCRRSAIISATGYSVFSVNSCPRPRITAMNPIG